MLQPTPLQRQLEADAWALIATAERESKRLGPDIQARPGSVGGLQEIATAQRVLEAQRRTAAHTAPPPRPRAWFNGTILCTGIAHEAAGGYRHKGRKNGYPSYDQVSDSRGNEIEDSPFSLVRRTDGRWVLTGHMVSLNGPRDATTGMSGGDLFICEEELFGNPNPNPIP